MKRTVNNIMMILLCIVALTGILAHILDMSLLTILHTITGILLCIFACIHVKQMKRS